MKQSIILAVDGGATKTTVTLRTIQGECLFEKTTTGSNYQTIGIDAVSAMLNDLLYATYLSTNLTSIDVAVFAMAGIDTKSDVETVTQIIEQSLHSTPFRIETLIIENDVQATLIGLVQNTPGVLLISGTGSIAFGTDGRNRFIRTGGWGHRASDEGSGYWIGRQILKAVFKAEDGLQPPTVLKKLLLEKLQINSVDQLVTWLYQPGYTNGQTASISPLLQEAISLYDEEAIHIAQSAAKELFLLVKGTLTKLHYDGEPLTLHLNGGILKHATYIRNGLEQFMHREYPHITIALCKENPIEYIVRRAKFALNIS